MCNVLIYISLIFSNTFALCFNLLRHFFSKEMRKVFCDSLLRSVNFATNHATNLILSFATFVAFVLLNGDLDLQVVSDLIFMHVLKDVALFW